jgi:hypothetical protein
MTASRRAIVPPALAALEPKNVQTGPACRKPPEFLANSYRAGLQFSGGAVHIGASSMRANP